jgi:hypothetical protein
MDKHGLSNVTQFVIQFGAEVEEEVKKAVRLNNVPLEPVNQALKSIKSKLSMTIMGPNVKDLFENQRFEDCDEDVKLILNLTREKVSKFLQGLFLFFHLNCFIHSRLN